MEKRKSSLVWQLMFLVLMIMNLTLSIQRLRQKREQEMFADTECDHIGTLAGDASRKACGWKLTDIIPWFKDDIPE